MVSCRQQCLFRSDKTCCPRTQSIDVHSFHCPSLPNNPFHSILCLESYSCFNWSSVPYPGLLPLFVGVHLVVGPLPLPFLVLVKLAAGPGHPLDFLGLHRHAVRQKGLHQVLLVLSQNQDKIIHSIFTILWNTIFYPLNKINLMVISSKAVIFKFVFIFTLLNLTNN